MCVSARAHTREYIRVWYGKHCCNTWGYDVRVSPRILTALRPRYGKQLANVVPLRSLFFRTSYRERTILTGSTYARLCHGTVYFIADIICQLAIPSGFRVKSKNTNFSFPEEKPPRILGKNFDILRYIRPARKTTF